MDDLVVLLGHVLLNEIMCYEYRPTVCYSRSLHYHTATPTTTTSNRPTNSLLSRGKLTPQLPGEHGVGWDLLRERNHLRKRTSAVQQARRPGIPSLVAS